MGIGNQIKVVLKNLILVVSETEEHVKNVLNFMGSVSYPFKDKFPACLTQN